MEKTRGHVNPVAEQNLTDNSGAARTDSAGGRAARFASVVPGMTLDRRGETERGVPCKCPVELSPTIHDRLRNAGAEMSTVVTAAWVGLLARYAGTAEQLVLGWRREDCRPDILPLVFTLTPETTGRDLVRQATSELAEAAAEPAFSWADLPVTATSGALLGLALAATQPPETVLPDAIDLILVVDPAASLTLCWHEGLFDEEYLEGMARHLAVVLERWLTKPEAGLLSFGLLTPSEQERVVETWNGDWAPFADDRTVVSLFEEAAARHPDRLAVLYEGGSLTYGELNERANRLAHGIREYLRRLQGRDIRPDDILALCVERNVHMVVGALAIAKAGGAYLPLDTAYPEERLRFMLADADVSLAITENCLLEKLLFLDASDCGVISMDSGADFLAEQPHDNPLPVATSHSLLYVIYTSGSTGKPKGVMIEHKSVVHLATAQNYVTIQPHDCVALSSSIAFDAATFELWAPLLNGARLAILDRDTLLSFDKLADAHLRFGVTIQFLTTALFNIIPDIGVAPLAGLRAVLFGGEEANAPQVRRLLAMRPAHLELIHVYGPTECTVYSTFYRLDDRNCAGRAIPIGRGLERMSLYVLDGQRRPVPVGVPGELYIGGSGVGRGYLKRPELTSERFIPNPFATDEQRRRGENATLYKTGDLVKWLPTGLVQFLGRVDFQVKIRGFRIELEEIESNLADHPEVARCAVTVFGKDAADKRLAAYFVPRPGTIPAVADLREHLARLLPAYMVPSTFTSLPALPLSPTGKVQRSALPPPQLGITGVLRTAPSRKSPPSTADERAVHEIVARALGQRDFGLDDDLIALGLHSLLAARIVAELRGTLGVDIQFKDVFEHPSVAGLARCLSGRPRDLAAPGRSLERVADHGAAPLTWQQEQIWFLSKLAPDLRAYNCQWTVRFRGTLSVPRLREALNLIVNRHEILRTTFHDGEDSPIQTVHPPWETTLREVDLSRRPQATREAEAEQDLQEELARVFDCSRLPLVRWTLYRFAPDDAMLLQLEHHFVHDGWEIAVFLRELKSIYSALTEGRPVPLPPLAVQYADYAVWQRAYLAGATLARKVDYWEQRLATYPKTMVLPYDQQRPARQSFRGAAIRREIPRPLYRALREFSRRQKGTLFVTMYSVFAALMAAWVRTQQRLIIGSGFANRTQSETEVMLGMFVNTVLLTADFSENPSVAACLRDVRIRMIEDAQHYDTPFSQIVARLRHEIDVSCNPLFQVMFAFHDSPVPILEFCGLTGTITERHNATAKVDLNVICIPRAEQHVALQDRNADEEDLTIVWEYNRDLFAPETMTTLLDRYTALLGRSVEEPEAPLLDMALATLGRPRSLASAVAQPPPAPVEATPTPAPCSGPIIAGLIEIWRKLLDTEEVGLHDSFFNIGGNSILAVRMLTRIKQRFGADVPAGQLFATPTIAALAARIENRPTEGSDRTLQLALADAAASLPVPAERRAPWTPGNVLLTGVTGFLGAYLASSLLRLTNARVYCLVRAVDEHHGQAKLLANLDRFGLGHEDAARRLIVVPGELSEPTLGLPLTRWNELADLIDVIVHAGARVHHLVDYTALRPANVEGTRELVRLATTGRVKLFDFVSTLATGIAPAEGGGLVEVELGDRPPSTNGYTVSKWVAEKLLGTAAARGLPVNVFRPGNIAGDRARGACPPELNHALLLLKGCLQLGVAPDWPRPVELVPVDLLADVIVTLGTESEGSSVFNLQNARPLSWRDYVAAVNRHGHRLDLVPLAEWRRRVETIDEGNALFPFKHFYSRAREDLLRVGTPPLRRYPAAAAQELLRPRGLAYDYDQVALLWKILDYLETSGFLPRPR